MPSLHRVLRGTPLVLLALALAGCATTDVSRSARWSLDPDGAFYVARPVDERYTGVFHERVGRTLVLRYPSSLLATREESAAAALASARYAGADYLFYPVIEGSTARRGLWQSAKRLKSFRRAALDVRVQVYDVHTGDLIETAVLAARGGLLGGAVSPNEGLERLLAAWTSV